MLFKIRFGETRITKYKVLIILNNFMLLVPGEICKSRHTIFPMRLKHDAHGVFLPMYFCFMAVLLVKYKGCMPQKYCKCSILPLGLERVISVFQLILPECMKLLPLYTNCILKNDSNDVRYLFSNLLIHS